MGAVEILVRYFKKNKRKNYWMAFFAACGLAGLILRIRIISLAHTPGTSDTAFYYTVARNIAEGRGLVIDYVIYYFNGLVPIPHYSNDYWLPLASILLSLPMSIFGKNVTSALLAPMLVGLAPSLVAYYAGKRFSKSSSFAVLSGALTFFSPIQVTASTVTDTLIFFGFFGSIALYLSTLGHQNSRYFLIAALCTGLAHMTRQDGILLLATLLLIVLMTKKTLREKALLAICVLSIHLTVISPLLIRNLAETHSVFSAGLSKTLFLTKYEDMYSYGKDLSWQTYRATWGIKRIAVYKFDIAGFNLSQLAHFMDPILALLASLGLINLFARRKWPELSLMIPSFIFLGLGYIFYSFIWSVHGPGSFYKSLAAVMPFLSILIIDVLGSYMHSVGRLTVAIICLATYSGYQGYQQAYQFNSYYNADYQNYYAMKEIILKDAGQRNLSAEDVVVMARSPWDINAATEMKVLMVPNNDIDTIVFVAKHYNAHYILLPASRPQLQKIYDNTVPDPRFHLVASIPDSDLKIFWMDFGP